MRKTRTEQDVQNLTGRRGPTEQRAVRWEEIDALATAIGDRLANTKFGNVFSKVMGPVDNFDEEALEAYLQISNTIFEVNQLIDSNTTYINNEVASARTDLNAAIQLAKSEALAETETVRTSLQSQVDGVVSDLNVNYYTAAGTDTAISLVETSLQSNIDGVSANLSSEQITRANADSAIAGDVSSLTTRVGSAETAITNEATTRSNADSAIASDVSSLTTRMGAAESSVTTNANAISTVEGYQAATYTLRVSAGGASAGFEVVAADNPISGPKSAIRMNADNILLDGTVTTPHLQANAVTADKINVTSLSAISATIGTFQSASSGERVVIKDDQILVYDSANRLRVKIGRL